MTMPQGERLARIESILERMEPKLDGIENKLDADVADLAKLKNRGVGLLIGVGLLGGGVGAGLAKFWASFFG